MTARVAYDPHGAIYARLPLDRKPYLLLAKTVLALDASADLPPDDCAQIALQLTGHANLVAIDVRSLCNWLPENSRSRMLTETVLADAASRLEAPAEPTIDAIKERAQVLRGLYERLDRLTANRPPTIAPAGCSRSPA
ncbi:restriction endonuclease [Streptomyces sp. SD31]|uniref:restriction endonuclease n=1 Tax=Streptomyces sp. SD31 TaxID=3452208 RepID=UPI003F89C0E3